MYIMSCHWKACGCGNLAALSLWIFTSFPGERASCYLSDFGMRQYKRVKDQQKEHFSFRDLKPVILIVIMEKVPRNSKLFLLLISSARSISLTAS